jgi:hypothetical protein
MTEAEYEKVIINVPAYIVQKTGTGRKISEIKSVIQCECQLVTVSPMNIEMSTETLKTIPA